MTYRPEHQKQGFTEVWYRDGTNRHLPRGDYEGLETAMREGKDFFEARSLLGGTGLIRVSCVVEIWDVTADVVRRTDEDEVAKAAYKQTHGEN